MSVNLHLVRTFSAVAEAGSFNRAAAQLGVSQPAVSRAVQELERQLDTPLLERTGRRVSLTAAGKVLNEHAVALFAIERTAETELAELRQLERGELAIGASSTIGIYLLPQVMGIFQRKHPGVRLFLDIGNTAQIVGRLRTGTLDTAFVEGPVSGSDLSVRPWRDDSLVVVAAADHPLCGRQPVTLDELIRVTFVLREPGSGTREVVEAALRERGVEVRVAMELGSTEAVKQAVAAGLGVSIVSIATISQELELGRLRVLDVPDLLVRRTLTRLSVIGRRPSTALREFLALDAAES
jgi:DNA-binding transcriptional LysR family regulator